MEYAAAIGTMVFDKGVTVNDEWIVGHNQYVVGKGGEGHGVWAHRVQNLVFLIRKLYENCSEKNKYHVHFIDVIFPVESLNTTSLLCIPKT